MEPLGAAASFVTVTGTLITSIDRAYSVIGGLQDVSKEIETLGQEVLELKADVKAASGLDVRSHQAPSSSQLQDPLAHHINRAQTALSAIES